MNAGTPDPVEFSKRHRSLRSVAVLAVVWASLAALLVLFDAARWLVALLALFTLPTLWDILSDSRSTFVMDDRQLDWQSGRHHRSVPLSQIARVRMDTRWDLSVRTTLILTDGTRQRIAQDCMPPHRSLEKAFQDRKIPVERHHFVVF